MLSLMPLNKVIAVLCREKMTEQQGNPDQLPAEKGQGGAGATYKVPNWRSACVCWNKSEMEWIVILCKGGDQTSSSSPPVLQLAVFEYENFRGKKVELSGECKDAFEKTQRIGSVIVESGPWVISLFFLNCSASFLLVVWPCLQVSVYPQMGGVWASRLCRRAVCVRERRVSSVEHLDQLPEFLQPLLIQASESGQYNRCNIQWWKKYLGPLVK